MNVRQLEVFEAIMRTGSVTGAARSLSLTQPAVSKILRRAEDELKFCLFQRVNGRLRPTPEAEILLPEVERVFGHLDLITRMELDIKNNMSGRIAIATPMTFADSVVSDAIARFLVARSRVRFSIYAASTRSVIDAILQRRVDIGLIFAPNEHPLLGFEEIDTAELVCAMPRDHPLAAHQVVTPRHLSEYALICGDRQTYYGRSLDEAFRAAGEQAEVSIEVTTSVVACALVQRGAGVALTDPYAVRRFYPQLVQRSFRPRIALNPRVIFLRDAALPRLVTEFIPYLKEAVVPTEARAATS